MHAQGIVPYKSVKMIGIATDLILNRLVDMKVEFGKVRLQITESAFVFIFIF